MSHLHTDISYTGQMTYRYWISSVRKICQSSRHVWRLPCNFTMDYIASSDKCLTFHSHILHTLNQHPELVMLQDLHTNCKKKFANPIRLAPFKNSRSEENSWCEIFLPPLYLAQSILLRWCLAASLLLLITATNNGLAPNWNQAIMWTNF